MNLVEIIACTYPDWPTLIKTCVKMFGSSPTRELDKRNIPVGPPLSYVLTLENINNNSAAIGNLKEANVSLDLVHITFLIHFEDIDIASHFNNLITVPSIRYNSKILFCATLRQLRDIVSLNDEPCKDVIIQMYNLLCKLGFKNLFGAQVFTKGTDSFQLLK